MEHIMTLLLMNALYAIMFAKIVLEVMPTVVLPVIKQIQGLYFI